ncbi:endoribonuclease MazF [Desulfocurvibacter africanus]|uniref:Transcriptional modulator of MazE/toxin, MazF n=1 Tax=Desulfocurvibacter africanus subsp. africanus str. Walvis Bay TaxID=690850 RepID=F3YXJ0_DESAF|nr:endoribonuclease MazF [Desulfocurvibacter africanus]EGJ51767.1 transcriptional modulator of MazE/toxin, MazF [Desulfocurvibacter africanus subsp. africanus str. Walvis Bay]
MVSGSERVPDVGELIWINLDPQAGHEQAGKRPALVLSPQSYNAKAGLCLAAPITSQVKGYPFEVALPAGLAISGVILADQLKNLDWRARRATVADQAPPEVLAEVRGKLGALLQF